MVYYLINTPFYFVYFKNHFEVETWTWGIGLKLYVEGWKGKAKNIIGRKSKS